MRSLLIALLLCCSALTPLLQAQHQAKEIGAIKANGEIGSVAFSADGKTLAFAGKDPSVRLWDIAARMEKAEFRATGNEMSVVFGNDGHSLAAGTEEGIITLWDVQTGKKKTAFKAHTALTSLAANADGTILASGGLDLPKEGEANYPQVRLWDITTGKEKASFFTRSPFIASIVFSPNAKLLAAAGGDGAIHLWNLAAGKSTATFNDSHNLPFPVIAVAFSPDGRMLASTWKGRDWKGREGTVKLWEVASCKERATLAGHTDHVVCVAFSPDGTVLASGSSDNTVKLWDVRTGKELATVKGHDGPVCCVKFSPEGKLLASGSRDGTVKLWDLSAFTAPVKQEVKQ